QDRNDLFFTETGSLHLSVLPEGRTLTQSGGNSQWQVTTVECRSGDNVAAIKLRMHSMEPAADAIVERA
ncbi:MAG TPA: hypothetical protein PKY73_00130, partial [Hyphomonas sp.]|nr:hypothetical protein [Hyphomonas sp.]